MLETLSGMLTLASALHPEKAKLPMLVTPSGISRRVRLPQLENALSPMAVRLPGASHG